MLKLALPLLILVVSSACGSPAPRCTTATCTGCCDAQTDTCRAGSEAAACGGGGTLCIECPSTQTCRSDRTCGAMVMNGGSCNASNCDGCCSSTGSCLVGQSANACGASGSSCQVCAGGQTCQPVDVNSQFGGRCTQ